MPRKTMAASVFKEKCLALLDSVSPDGLVITKHGKPVAMLVPVTPNSASLIGALHGKLKIKGDLMSTGVRWNAQS